MKTRAALSKKSRFGVMGITLIALTVSLILYWLLTFFQVPFKLFFYVLTFIVVFVPAIAIYISYFLKTLADREADESEERYRVLVETSPAGILSCDRNGNITMVNAEVVKLLGSPSAEATKQVNVFTFEPLIEIGLSANLKKCMETGQVYRGETHYVTKWGKRVYMRMHFAPYHNSAGEIVGVQGIIEDFTEYKKSQDQLRTYYQAMEHSPVAVIITDANHQIEYINPKYTKLTGYQPEELLGQNSSVLYQRESVAKDYIDLATTVNAGQVWQREIYNVRKNGDRYWENIQISPVFDDDGRISHFVGIKEDITERRQESEKTSYLAYHDGLTRLPNRELFHDRMILAAASADRFSSQMALMYLDLDGFKEINDAYGHDAGDELLKAVASRLEGLIRKGDTLARLGGDEFALLISDFKAISDVEIVARKILIALEEPLTARKLSVTVSIGISFYPDHGKIMEVLLKNADQAMYQAKKLGKNNYQIFKY